MILAPKAGVFLIHLGHVFGEDLLQLGQPATWRLKLDEPCAAVRQADHAVGDALVRGAGELVGPPADGFDLSYEVSLYG